MLSTDLMYRALPFIYQNKDLEEFIVAFKVPEDIQDEFREFWQDVLEEVTEARAEDPNIVWDVPSEWP